ncbi:MAG: hypothetical protein RL062_1485 [Bacteroidota bacterium]|jgi:O-antigen/teichoic acid export membrane protein
MNKLGYFKLSALYSALAALPPILQLLVQPWIEGDQLLGAADFSQIGIAEQVTILAYTIVLFSMSAALTRFYYDVENDEKKYNKLVSGTLISILIRGLGVLLAAFLLKDFIGPFFTQSALQQFETYGFAAIGIGINRAIYMSAAALYRNEKKVMAFVGLNVSLAFLRSAFQVIGVLYWDLSFLGYVYGSLVGSSLVTLVILMYSFKKCGWQYDRSFMKPLNAFAWPLFQYAIVSWALYFVDKYFLESQPETLGIYITAMNFANGLQLIIQGVQAATQPEVFRFFKDGLEKNQESIRSLGNMLIVQTQLLLTISIIPIAIYIQYFFDSEIQNAASFVAIILIRFIPRSQYFVFSFVLFYEKKTKVLSYLNFLNLFIAIVLNYLLIPIMGIYGVIISVLVAECILTWGVLWYSKRHFDIAWNWNKVLYIPTLVMFLVMILEFLKVSFHWSVISSSILATLVFVIGLMLAYRAEFQKVVFRK